MGHVACMGEMINKKLQSENCNGSKHIKVNGIFLLTFLNERGLEDVDWIKLA
jgi:hypothetical protein